MPSPLLFFIFIIVVDLLLKSARDKKKIEESKKRKIPEQGRQPQQQKQPRKSGPFADLRKILEEEIQKERQREFERKNIQGEVLVEPEPKVERRPKVDYDLGIKPRSVEEKPIQEEKVESAETKTISKGFKEDIIKGIIFSEILSEPKGVKNQRRSL